MNQHSDPDAVLRYLQQIDGYHFVLDVDENFVAELLTDFASLDVLEQIKAFRWHYDGNPGKYLKSLRPAIRRWLASAAKHLDREPF